MTDKNKPEQVSDDGLDAAQGGGAVAAHEIAHIDRGGSPTPGKTGKNAVRLNDLTTDNHG